MNNEFAHFQRKLVLHPNVPSPFSALSAALATAGAGGEARAFNRCAFAPWREEDCEEMISEVPFPNSYRFLFDGAVFRFFTAICRPTSDLYLSLAGQYPGSEDPIEADKRLKALTTTERRVEGSFFFFSTRIRPSNAIFRAIAVVRTKWSPKRSDRFFSPYAPKLKAIADEMGIETVFYRFGIRDLGVPSRDLMVLILDTIEQSIEGKRPVYVHCRGGIGRTGTVVGCYLARRGYAFGEDIFAEIQYLRRLTPSSYVKSPETPEQQEIVGFWGKGD